MVDIFVFRVYYLVYIKDYMMDEKSQAKLALFIVLALLLMIPVTWIKDELYFAKLEKANAKAYAEHKKDLAQYKIYFDSVCNDNRAQDIEFTQHRDKFVDSVIKRFSAKEAKLMTESAGYYDSIKYYKTKIDSVVNYVADIDTNGMGQRIKILSDKCYKLENAIIRYDEKFDAFLDSVYNEKAPFVMPVSFKEFVANKKAAKINPGAFIRYRQKCIYK